LWRVAAVQGNAYGKFQSESGVGSGVKKTFRLPII